MTTEARDALAKALFRAEWGDHEPDEKDHLSAQPEEWFYTPYELADLILAALDGWTLVPVARLREVEQERDAALTHNDEWDGLFRRSEALVKRLLVERDAARAAADRLAEALRHVAGCVTPHDCFRVAAALAAHEAAS